MRTPKEWLQYLLVNPNWQGALRESEVAAIQRDALVAALNCVFPDGNPEVARQRIIALVDPDWGPIIKGHTCKHGTRWPHYCETCLNDINAFLEKGRA